MTPSEDDITMLMTSSDNASSELLALPSGVLLYMYTLLITNYYNQEDTLRTLVRYKGKYFNISSPDV